MKQFVIIAFVGVSFCQAQAQERSTSRAPTVIYLDKRQLAGVLIAKREMEKAGQTIRGQQVRIEDNGKTMHISFLEDPINMAVVGSDNGLSFEIRRRDLKVLRVIHDR
jgi:hypothetical protein